MAWNYQPGTDHCFVGFDNRAAAREMAEKVLDFGHVAIGMIAGLIKGNDRARDRVAGVADAIAANANAAVSLQVIEAPYSFSDGGDAIEMLLSKPPRPTVVICGNDILAVRAIKCAKSLGLRVPQDVSITGFDDIEVASIVEPELTTVHVPHREMGKLAATCLLELRKSDIQSPSHRLTPLIVERGSLGPPCRPPT